VDGAVIEQTWAARPEDRRDQGIFAQDAVHRAARPDPGRERQHLVYRQQCRPYWQARSQYRPGDRIQIARCGPAKDPHTLIFDKEGILWFTVQQANRIGRLDPKSGEIKLVTSPTPKSRPYGMALNSKNVVFFVEFGANNVASIDSKTMEIKEYPLPDPGARPASDSHLAR
jgi:hypothetical protein